MNTQQQEAFSKVPEEMGWLPTNPESSAPAQRTLFGWQCQTN
jgi:hypothetical protein